MAFERIQKQTHTIAEQTVVVSYDRFTTRFEIKNKQNELRLISITHAEHYYSSGL